MLESAVQAASPADLIWSTTRFGPRDRLDAWMGVLEASHLPWRLSEKPAEDFYSSLQMRRFEDFRLIRCACDAMRGYRSVTEIAKTDSAYLSVLCVRQGREFLRIEGTEIMMQAGDFVLWDSARRMEFHVPERLEKLTLMFPAQRLLSIDPRVEDVVGVPIDGKRGLGALFAEYLTVLEREMWHVDGLSLAGAMQPTLELLATALGGVPRTSSRSMREITLERVKSYIQKHLRDEDLSPQRIAGAHRISTRYLHLLFEEMQTTVASWIRAERLKRARRDLALSLTNGQSVTEIAYAWGFKDASHFGKAFRREFQMSPKEYRERVARLHAVPSVRDGAPAT